VQVDIFDMFQGGGLSEEKKTCSRDVRIPIKDKLLEMVHVHRSCKKHHRVVSDLIVSQIQNLQIFKASHLNYYFDGIVSNETEVL
jgi:hypothetical protein